MREIDRLIRAPKRLDELSALRMADEIALESRSSALVPIAVPQDLVLDPFAVVYLANVCEELRLAGTRFELDAVDHESYASHIGFYEIFSAESKKVEEVGTRSNER